MGEDGKSGLIGLLFFPVEVLGPGKRLGIWFQGCSNRCPDCVSPHSWDFDETCRTPLAQVEQKLKFYSLFTEKLTISGGEPFEQPLFLQEVIKSARSAGYRDIFVYSGKLFEDLQVRHPELIGLIDVIVDGAFRKDLPTKKIWRGSANQRLIACSQDPVLKAFYEEYADADEAHDSMQVVQSGKRAFVVGIPREGKGIDPLR